MKVSYGTNISKLSGPKFAVVAALKNLKNIVAQSQLCSVFHAIVESHLRFANVIWGSPSKTKLDTLQHLHGGAHSRCTHKG